VQDVEVLALVLVDALHLHVEEALRVDLDPQPALHHRRQRALVGGLDLPPALAEGAVLDQGLEGP
jgi:hypothetical protein